MKSKIIPFFLLIGTISAFAQSADGYWDNQRITNKEIKLSAGEKIIVKSEDLPVGTTEFVYRITLLDENQKMVNDLASVLKAIPDPYYIGKGTGGAITLLSGISGTDKCTYAVFQEQQKAADFSVSGKFDNACVYQKNPVSKDAKLISLAKNTCLDDDVKTIWFAFKNENWMMNEKIVLEIVPWVDKIASRGWTAKRKNEVVENLMKTASLSYLKKETSRNVALSLFNQVEEKFRYQDFKALSADEQKFEIERLEEKAFIQNDALNLYYEMICYKANLLAQKGNVDEAIAMIESKVTSKPTAKAVNYNSLAELYMKSKQFEKALKTLKNAENIDPSELKVQMNLAHVYMFMDNVSASKEIHKKYRNQNVSAKQTWKNKAINDLDGFKKTNLPQENIGRIWKLYN
ncbi:MULTISPECIES: tetratricopeptide repeat protein [unclassified Flavobacterium]|uniref:tetratricopeptide repeat protein n=1 Tax=unclassified Flavobacterium TaxID=196869 RepID=UPI00360D9313